MRLSLITITLLFFSSISFGQTIESDSEIEQISKTLMLYIDGTANGQLEKLKEAFHPDFNLYSVTQEDSLRIWKGSDYTSKIKKGQKSNRVGRIISIDFDQNVATAKAEIIIPERRVFTDFFLLVKYLGKWKIVHKSYTYKSMQ
ncbi:hypothetical protein GCM10009117_05120 [Gangjinia marincola]|uniref:Lumazine-binding protein n=1 Tax=Gangjinia marincola TaxID=578463 RepID=A0ABP3XQ55_9FLAO